MSDVHYEEMLRRREVPAEGLMRDHDIPAERRDDLIAAVHAADQALHFTKDGLIDEALGDGWDDEWKEEQAAKLDPVVRAGSQFIEAIRGAEGFISLKRVDIQRLCDDIERIIHAAETARQHEKRPQSRPRRDQLRSAVTPLAGFWKSLLKRRFTYGQFQPGAGGNLEPMTPANRFVYDVIEHLRPGAGVELRSILREFVG
jgi:hypothetical protein